MDDTYTAFVDDRCLASGSLASVLGASKCSVEGGQSGTLLMFEDRTGRQVEFDLRGSEREMLERELPAAPVPRPGRPKLGVTSREISLLPRHWAWLEQQPSGASAALRRLVEVAMKQNPGRERARLAQEATSRVMTVLAGNLPHFEEASRALFAGDEASFEARIASFPTDVRSYLVRLSRAAFAPRDERAASA